MAGKNWSYRPSDTKRSVLRKNREIENTLDYVVAYLSKDIEGGVEKFGRTD